MGESLLAIDYRPLTGELYGLGSTSRGYRIAPTGQATAVGPSFAIAPSGTAFGVDFNPVADRLRIVRNNEQNMRWDSTSGAIVGNDAALTPPGSVVAAA